MTEIKPAMAQFPLEAPSPLTVAKKLAKAINGMACPVCGGNDFALDPEYRDDIYRVRCNRCGNILTFDREIVNSEIPKIEEPLQLAEDEPQHNSEKDEIVEVENYNELCTYVACIEGARERLYEVFERLQDGYVLKADIKKAKKFKEANDKYLSKLISALEECYAREHGCDKADQSDDRGDSGSSAGDTGFEGGESGGVGRDLGGQSGLDTVDSCSDGGLNISKLIRKLFGKSNG